MAEAWAAVRPRASGAGPGRRRPPKKRCGPQGGGRRGAAGLGPGGRRSGGGGVKPGHREGNPPCRQGKGAQQDGETPDGAAAPAAADFRPAQPAVDRTAGGSWGIDCCITKTSLFSTKNHIGYIHAGPRADYLPNNGARRRFMHLSIQEYARRVSRAGPLLPWGRTACGPSGWGAPSAWWGNCSASGTWPPGPTPRRRGPSPAAP